LFFQRKLYCKHFLSKTYPAIVASRRQKHDHQSEKDEEKDEEEGKRYIDITGVQYDIYNMVDTGTLNYGLIMH
jgi:hypothetical protein